jgi:hypothetical protein
MLREQESIWHIKVWKDEVAEYEIAQILMDERRVPKQRDVIKVGIVNYPKCPKYLDIPPRSTRSSVPILDRKRNTQFLSPAGDRGTPQHRRHPPRKVIPHLAGAGISCHIQRMGKQQRTWQMA